MKLPEKYPDEPAYLWGVVCNNCGAKYLGHRTACGNCGSTGPFEETRFGDEGEIYSFAVVHQTVPGLEAPYVAAIVDLDDGVSVRANVYGLDISKPGPEWYHVQPCSLVEIAAAAFTRREPHPPAIRLEKPRSEERRV